MSATNPLFMLPAILTGPRPAQTVQGRVQQLYQANNIDDARAFETLQQYLDSVNGDVSAIIGVLQGTNTTGTDSGVTINGSPVNY